MIQSTQDRDDRSSTLTGSIVVLVVSQRPSTIHPEPTAAVGGSPDSISRSGGTPRRLRQIAKTQQSQCILRGSLQLHTI